MAKRKHQTFRPPTPGEVTKTMLADGTQQWLFTGRAADEVRRGLELQRAAFVAKFGREPVPTTLCSSTRTQTNPDQGTRMR